MPRGVYVRSPELKQKLRDAWYSSEKSKTHILSLRHLSQTPEARAKRSESVSRLFDDPKIRKRWSEAQVGHVVSQETREKLRRSLTKLTDEQRRANKRIAGILSGALRRVMKKIGARKIVKSEQILGYTREQLRAHLEAQFRPGMSWESGGFHVDHIKPVAAFIREGVTDPAVIHALDNLQILTPHENLTKSDKFPFLQVPA